MAHLNRSCRSRTCAAVSPTPNSKPRSGEMDLALSEGMGRLMGEVALHSGLESLVELGEVDFNDPDRRTDAQAEPGSRKEGACVGRMGQPTGSGP